MTTSVVVVSYMPHRWLEQCLASVVGVADEVVLVDNGSPGGAVGAVGRQCGASVHVLPTNTGFAGGVNTGVRHAKGDIIALLNDDAIAGSEWLPAASAVLTDPSVAAVGPKITFLRQGLEVSLPDEAQFFPPDPRPLGRWRSMALMSCSTRCLAPD
jgi:GT2 family glycosyltransferase